MYVSFFRLKHKHNVDLIIPGSIIIHCDIEKFPTDAQQSCVLMYFEGIDVRNTSKSRNEFKFDTDASILSRAKNGCCQNAFGSMAIKKKDSEK